MEKLNDLLHIVNGKNPLQSLRLLADLFPNKIAFSTSFGIEDQLISSLIFKNSLAIEVFTLDTGRLFPETYSTWARTIEFFENSAIKTYAPQSDSLQEMTSKHGPNLFYESVEKRKLCCNIRKVEPLNRALENIELWITGIRADQSENRHTMQEIEWDEGRKLYKFHPLFHYSFEEVKAEVSKNGYPSNPLHEKGFPSIGCAPCTRAVSAGEDIRSGRWWWEDNSKKECGLHAK